MSELTHCDCWTKEGAQKDMAELCGCSVWDCHALCCAVLVSLLLRRKKMLVAFSVLDSWWWCSALETPGCPKCWLTFACAPEEKRFDLPLRPTQLQRPTHRSRQHLTLLSTGRQFIENRQSWSQCCPLQEQQCSDRWLPEGPWQLSKRARLSPSL